MHHLIRQHAETLSKAHILHALSSVYAEHKTYPKANSYAQTDQRNTLSFSWTASHHETVALAAAALVQDAETWLRTEEGGCRERVDAEISSDTAIYSPTAASGLRA